MIASFSFTQSANPTIHYSSSLFLRILTIDAPPSCAPTRISKGALSSDYLVATYKYNSGRLIYLSFVAFSDTIFFMLHI